MISVLDRLYATIANRRPLFYAGWGDVALLNHLMAGNVAFPRGMIRNINWLDTREVENCIIKRSWEATGEALSLLADLPNDLTRLLRTARRGRFEIHIEVTNLKRVGNQLEKAANRLVVGIVVAALIIGSSIVMTVTGGPSLIGLSFFASFGFSSAVIGGLWLLMSIWKSSRADKEKPQ